MVVGELRRPRLLYDETLFRLGLIYVRKLGYIVLLLSLMPDELMLIAAGMFSILGTAVTSSMTRNMWKNFRGLVVWIAALIIYYAIGDEDLGEPWLSFMILGGFSVMLIALYVYYNGLNWPLCSD
jgi:hypothetical protein